MPCKYELHKLIKLKKIHQDFFMNKLNNLFGYYYIIQMYYYELY